MNIFSKTRRNLSNKYRDIVSCRTVVNRWTDNGLANIIPLLPIADGSTADNNNNIADNVYGAVIMT